MKFEVGGKRVFAAVSPEGQDRRAIQTYTSLTSKTNSELYNTFADKDQKPELTGSDWDYTFSDFKGIKKISVSIYNESLEHLEKMIEMGFKEGFAMTLNGLVSVLKIKKNTMKSIFVISNVCKPILLITILFFTVFKTSGQQSKSTESGYAPVNGIKVYYEVYGQGMPVILLHGSFYTIDLNWSQIIPELSKHRKVIAIEMQGHGHSPYSDRELSITNLANDVEKVMDYLKINSADVAGFSMGGSVAYQFAVQSPKRLRKLVIISSTYKPDGYLPIVNTAFEGFKPDFFDNTPLKTAYYAVAPDTTKWTKFIKQMLDFAKVPFNSGDTNIAKINSPVLIISGDNDGLDKVELMKTYQLLGGGVSADLQPMPKSQLAVVPSQGHVSLMMQTKTILAYLDDFLK